MAADVEISKPHGNRKHAYPAMKPCQVCSTPFPVVNRYQAARNKTCSTECAGKMISAASKGRRTPLTERKGRFLKCPTCGKTFWRVQSRILLAKLPVCSRHCGSVLRGRELAKHAHKAAAARTPAGLASFIKKMSGPNNPAWKGGVTYFKTHGNYKGVKYVRCPPAFSAMARKDGYVMEHRLFVAQALGRCLTRKEVVHHDDHNPTNNVITNLALFRSNSEHKLFEHHGFPLPIWHG